MLQYPCAVSINVCLKLGYRVGSELSELNVMDQRHLHLWLPAVQAGLKISEDGAIRNLVDIHS